MSSAPVVIPPDIQFTAGPLFLGGLLNWTLFGALSVQTYIYYMAFPNDRLAMKFFVYGLYLLEAAQSIMVIHDAFQVYAMGYGNAAVLGSIQLAWLSLPLLCGTVSCSVQLFFAFRIYALSGSKYVGGAISLISLTQFVAAVVQSVQVKVINDFVKIGTEAKTSAVIWLTGSAVCDIVIAICMCYYLSRKTTNFRQTQIIVNRLMRLTIETGTLTATVATVDLIVFLAFPNNNFHTTPTLSLAKLYSNTLLMVFNSRLRIVGGRDDSRSTELAEIRTTMSTVNAPSGGSGTQLSAIKRSSTHRAQNVVNINTANSESTYGFSGSMAKDTLTDSIDQTTKTGIIEMPSTNGKHWDVV